MFGSRSKKKTQRGQPRHSMRFAVRSRGLPGFRAITADLSQTGAQLETEGPMQEGAELILEMEFDREDIRDFDCPAQVVWSIQDEHGRHYRTGVVFQPADDAQRTALARMATVLQARSESDLETLLDEAKMLDPERAETFTRVRAQASAQGSQPAGKRGVLPFLGIFIPIRMAIEGYQWERRTGLLTLLFVDAGGQEHRLYYPGCRLLTDYGCAARPVVEGLFCTPHSDVIKRLPKPPTDAGWKHYRFLMADRQPVLELVSAPCQSTPGLQL